MKKTLALFAVAFAALLTGCGRTGDTPTIPVGDPGRVTTIANNEIVVKKMGYTNTVFIGDIASKTCLAKVTEIRTGFLWFRDEVSTSITSVPGKACGFEEPNQQTVTTWHTSMPCTHSCTPCNMANPALKKAPPSQSPCAANAQPPTAASSAPKS
ncbi:MAG: hypothetical protein RI935_286 [Candidatus Parcubacteria bacterium]